ncbi:MucBP domain-containing protein [Streptococcus suis]|uniref:MucBP domain-containing protein n=7 Tax=Streptococcus suis TaxID=1307 RepID=UPI000CF654EA|nr:MucBP domain-containing protein [Streptococcus suis]
MRHNGKNQMFPDKRQRFSIRKFKTGVASVVFVALFLGNMATVAAEQVPTNTDSSAKEVMESDVALPTDETLDKVTTTDEEVAPIEEGVDASLAPLESAEAPQEFRAAVGTERSAATNTKGVVVTPGQGIKTISEIPTDGFTTTEPEVKSMNPNFTGTVNHDPKNYTFAVIKTDNLNKTGPNTGHLFVNEKTGEVVTSSSNGATRIHQMAFSTDSDGTGTVYVHMYSEDGRLLMWDSLVPRVVEELKFDRKNWWGKLDRTYSIKYASVITINGTFPVVSVSTSDASDGWFDELYTNYERALGHTDGRYMGYGWFVPRLIDKKTEYVVKDSNKVLATVTQTEMSGYKFTTAAPETITADGVTYKLIKDSGVNTSGLINPLVMAGDATAVGTDKGYFIRYLMKDDAGQNIEWELLDPNNEVATTTDGKPARGTLRYGEDKKTYATVRVKSTNTDTTFYINNPYFPGGRTVYYYEVVPTSEVPKGSVTVKHVTTTGEVLKKETPVKTDEPVGTLYETQPEDKIVTDNGRTFVYKGLKEDSADPKGEVKEGTQKVTFVYEEVKGNVTVEHVTTDGKVLKAETPVFSENQSTGTAYETKNETELKDEAGNVYVFKEHKADSAPVSGKVTETAQKVVYVYELKPVTPTPSPTPDAPKGDVTVEHVTTTGEVLKEETSVKTNEPVGTPYETKPEDKIVTDNGRTFVYKGLKEDSADPKGEVKEGTQKVTFVYEEIKGNVTVEHVTTDGKVLKAETPVFSEKQSTGTAYETKNETELKDEAGNVYVFKEHKADSAPVSGKVIETAQKVVYVYELKPVTPTPSPTPDAPKGNVTVEHITTTGEVLKKETPVKTDEPVGSPYETQPEDKIVTDNGRTFVYKGLKEDSADPKGEIKEGTQKVTFVYEEVKGNVTVEHVTTDGKVLKAETPVFSENQSTGTAYETKNETELKDEAGNVYVFKEHKADSAPVSGKVIETAQKVVYVYELKPVTPTPSPTPDAPKGNVTVEHITTTGEVLKKENSVKTNEPVGTPYETQPEDKIVTDNGRTFVYKGLNEDSADPTGEVKEGTQKVTFVYEEIKGNVTVEHVTTDGKVLKAETPVFSENQSTGTAYETKNETELKDEAGNVYVFKEHKADSAPVSGKVTETAQKVVYVYELKPVTPTPTPEVSKPKSTTPATPTQDSSIPTSVVSTNKAQLPNTGEDNSVAFATLGTAMLVATFALNGKRRQDEN